MTIREAKYNNGYQVLSTFQPDESVNVFTAVMGRGKQLINANDYLSYIKDGKVYLLLYLSKILTSFPFHSYCRHVMVNWTCHLLENKGNHALL